MHRDQLKPNAILCGPLFPEPVQVIVAVPLGDAVKVVARGLRSGQVCEPVLAADQLARLDASPDREPLDGRFVEAKGRAGVGEVVLSDNEYRTAVRLK